MGHLIGIVACAWFGTLCSCLFIAIAIFLNICCRGICRCFCNCNTDKIKKFGPALSGLSNFNNSYLILVRFCSVPWLGNKLLCDAIRL